MWPWQWVLGRHPATPRPTHAVPIRTTLRGPMVLHPFSSARWYLLVMS